MADNTNYKMPSSKAEAAQVYTDQQQAALDQWRASDTFQHQLSNHIDDIRQSIYNLAGNGQSCMIKRDIHTGENINYSMMMCRTVLTKIKEHNPTYTGSCTTYIESDYGGTYVRLTVDPHF